MLYECLVYFYYDRALLLNVPGMFILITLCSFTGLVMYAYYVNCDPIKTHEAGNPNQVQMILNLDRRKV
jgi:sodium-coupled monocarboxylate transporter 8/12